ncbi:MAG TPA: universal stress protein [Nitrospirae bacterium]|nr:universal stress protein family protein [bacterium BMS3Abin06]HDH10730.1 universal stress protein [Nitrospirota bacterium]HDZ03018.1 universal stress protein [Nitrospirota bacterium]
MKKILIAVDETKGSKDAFETGSNICSCMRPDSIVLVFVEKFEGRSLMDEMLGEAEMSTLREELEGTEYKEALDKKADRILEYYRKALKEKGITGVKSVIKAGHPADEILKTADEEGVDMIIIGSRGKRTSHVFMGSVSREVVNRSEVPVFVIKERGSH